jgi:predicted transport protein
MEYFNLLSDRKSDFILELHSKLGIPADIKKIDWSASRVVFIGKNFNQRQRRAIDFQGLPIELWSYEWYEDGFFDLEQEGLKKQAKLEIAGIGKNKSEKIAKISTEFVEYGREHHQKKSSDETWVIFEKIEKEILKKEYISEKINMYYIDFKINGTISVFSIEIQKKKIIIYFGRNFSELEINNYKELEQLLLENATEKQHWGNGDWKINIEKKFSDFSALFIFIDKHSEDKLLR